MSHQECLVLEDKLKTILAYEDKIARNITARVLEKPELSVWMILIPIVFVPFMQQYQRYKDSAKAFNEGYLYTKKIAIDLSYRILKKEISHQDLHEVTKNIVIKNPDADQIVLNTYYSQIQEIEILCAHYLALFASKKVSYGEMIIDYYQTKDNYLIYLKRLADAEKEVTGHSVAAFKDGMGEASDDIKKMEKHLLEIRLEEAELFFSQS